MVIDSQKLEAEVFSFGRELFNEVKGSTLGLLDPQFYTAKLMDWSMRDEDFKVALFRFVDVYPTLSTSEAIISHAQEYFEPVADRFPGILKWGFRVDPRSLMAKVAATAITHQIKSMAARFIVGQTAAQGIRTLRQIRANKMCFTVDLLGEAALGELESGVYVQRYLELFHTLTREFAKEKSIFPGHRGDQTPINVSVKLSALYSQTKAIAEDYSVDKLSEAVYPIFKAAKDCNAFVYLDMEDTSLVSITLRVFKRLAELPEFKGYSQFGLVLQAYLRRTERDLDELLHWLKGRQTAVAVRLVKGAYWDTETIFSKQKGWGVPVWENKRSTDANYERLSAKLLQNTDLILPAFASHNLRSLTYAVKLAEMLGVDRSNFELQALYGMAEPVKKAFSDRGYLVREYAPVGELIPGMSYLVRRLLENTSNEGFLRQSFHENETPEVLLACPETVVNDLGNAHLVFNHRESFHNAAFRDFSEANVRDSFARQIQLVGGRGRAEVVKAVVSGKRYESERKLYPVFPETKDRVIAEVNVADVKLCDAAVEQLAEFFPTWRATSVGERAEILFKAADVMESRRDEFSATIVLEVGKPWAEADADVCEAIDFCRYYAHEMVKLSSPKKMGDYPGESNLLWYEPRGVTAVIAPWNFPLAIPCGMFAASLVTGNCTILKPAEQSSLTAQMLFDAFIAAGLPEAAAALLPGLGEEIGAHLVKHRGVETVVFTGSKAVGLRIIEEAAKTPGTHVKRVIAEMGGKNAIIVDDDADLDEAVRGVVYSAFGFQGQKCSACSRVIVVGGIYERFRERLKDAVQSIVVGPASDPASMVGPVIDQEAFDRISRVIARSKEELQVLVEAELDDAVRSRGFFIRPVVFEDVPHSHPLFNEEVFGPVLAVVKVDSFQDAVTLAQQGEYGLTGGVFSRSPSHIQYAVENYRVGNLYINRGCTGALVMRQPFGGSKMSGVGSKAGGPDYLQQFLIPRAVSENTVRRGFAPK